MITLLHGDNTVIIPTLAPRSVQAIVTSPPYYGLRDYGLQPTDWPEVTYAPMAGVDPITIPAMSCCLGLEPTPSAYIGHLVYVWRLLRDVLRDDGVCWLNLGDSYATTRNDHDWLKSGAKGFKGNFIPPGLKPKDLLMIPARAALALQADGYYLRSDIIWSKPNPMPESVTDRPTKAHEYLFLLAKNERYFYDAAAIAEAAQQRIETDTPIRRQYADGARGKRDGGGNDGLGNTNGTRNRRTVWTVATQPYAGAHFATWPEALVEPCVLAGSAAQACEHCGAPWVRVVEREKGEENGGIKSKELAKTGMSNNGTGGSTLSLSGSSKGWQERGSKMRDLGFAPSCTCPDNTGSARSIVLDPFSGSGTTMRVCERLQRDSIGIDLNQDYIELQEKRTDKVQVEMLL